MFKDPVVKLGRLRKGDCFMLNQEPYIVKKTYWNRFPPMIKLKMYVCQMKFEDFERHLLADEDVYRISRLLFDNLVLENQQDDGTREHG